MSAEGWGLACSRVIEASAGTGKTYTITTLICRLVADEGVSIRQLLVTTFTNAAAAELRERVRGRLSVVLAQLSEATRGADDARAPGDSLAAHWATQPELAQERCDRLRAALSSMDEATITTIHGFCQRSLQELPFEAGTDIGRTLVKDATALTEAALADAWAEVVADLPADLLPMAAAGLNAELAATIARGAIDHPDLPIVPNAIAADAIAGQLAAAVQAIEAQVKGIDCSGMASRMKANSVLTKSLVKLSAGVSTEALQARIDHLSECMDAWKDDCASKAESATLKAHQGRIAEHRESALQLMSVKKALERALAATTGAIRAQLAAAARRSAGNRKRRERTLTFDDMLLDMHRALHGPGAAALQQAVRARYSVALVDEFQDTDRMQCEIFERLFGDAGSRLFLVGDPKQSIYLFRGADVNAYMGATTAPRFSGERSELTTNYRTDRALLDAVQALMSAGEDGDLGGPPGGMPGIRLAPVAARHEGDRLLAADGSPASGLRVLHGDPDLQQPDALESVRTDEVAARVAEGIRLELQAGLTLPAEGGPGGPAGMRRALEPGDIAVLVQTNKQVERMQEALRAKGIPSVTKSTETVWSSPQADEIERVLRAVANPASLRLRRAAAATEVAGLDSRQVRALGDEADERALEQCAEWVLGLRESLDAHGPVSFARRMLDVPTLEGQEPAMLRMLARAGGERAITDMLHLAELLGRLWREGVRSAEELAAAMVVARAERSDDPRSSEDLQQRVESDGSGVRVLTVHIAKGLEWPVVWVPSYAMTPRRSRSRDRGALVAELAGSGDEQAAEDSNRVLAVGGDELDAATAVRENDERREKFRLMYVALTRARHRCNVVWAPAFQRANGPTPLGALLHGRDEQSWADAVAKSMAALASESQLLADLNALKARARAGSLMGTVVVEQLPVRRRSGWERPPSGVSLVPARTMKSTLPLAARTTSFSGLTRLAHESAGPAADARVRTDDAQGGEAAASVRSGDAPLLSRQVLPAGPSYGDLVHRVLEDGLAIIGTPQFADCVERACLADGSRCDAKLLAAGLQSIARQPLLAGTVRGVQIGDATLAGLGAGLARVELEYLLPAGTPQRPLTVQGIARALSQGGEIAKRYAPAAAALGASALHGHLTGFIDLACERDGKWYVLDYKTNALGTTLESFEPGALDEAMVSSHYVLQYHLYSLAVHRWLRSRVPGYSYETHFGGALYLFVRGMGAERPAGSGVFADRPSLALMRALDAEFEGRSA